MWFKNRRAKCRQQQKQHNQQHNVDKSSRLKSKSAIIAKTSPTQAATTNNNTNNGWGYYFKVVVKFFEFIFTFQSSSTNSPTVHVTPPVRNSPNYIKPQLPTCTTTSSVGISAVLKRFSNKFFWNSGHDLYEFNKFEHLVAGFNW